MSKRLTSLRLSQLTDYQIGELSDRWEMTAAEVVALAVDRLYREQRWGLTDRAMTLPALVYTLLYDRLQAGGLPDMDRLAALDWFAAWVKDNAAVDMAEDHQEARAAVEGAVQAWRQR